MESRFVVSYFIYMVVMMKNIITDMEKYKTYFMQLMGYYIFMGIFYIFYLVLWDTAVN